VGCVSSAAQGGSCGSGAAAGAAGSAWSNYGVKYESLVANVVAHAVVGGTTSVLGGGKFANGAATAAFGYLFNECTHSNCLGRDTSWEGVARANHERLRAVDGPIEGVYPEAYLLGIGGVISAAGNGLKLAFSGGANSVFWSGYSMGALDTAASLGTTLEATIGGRFLSWVNHNVGIKIPDSVWNWASSTFANQASGKAQAVIRAEGRVWTTIEKPILQQRGIPIEYHP
jgi:hypothetical protein